MLGSIYHPSRSTSVKRCQHYVARGGSTAFIFKHCGILQTASLANKIQQVRLKSVKKRQKDSWIRKTHSFISLSQSHTLPSPASRVHQGASVCAPSVGLDLSLATHILSLSLSLCWDDDLSPEPSNAKGTVRLSESIGANMVRARRVNEFSAVLEHSTSNAQFWLVWKQTCPSLFLVRKPTLL